MLTAILTLMKDSTSQGITLGTVAVLLVATFFLLYIPVYAVVIRPRRKVKAEDKEEEKPKEKTIKPKMPEYNQCSLNEIMGYDFIQTKYISGKEKGQPEQQPAESKPKSFADSTGIGMTEGNINESVIGVTGREGTAPQDEPAETPEERAKREAQKAAQLEQEKRLKMIEEENKEIGEDDIPMKLEGDMELLYNTDWPEEISPEDEMSNDWAAPYDDGTYEGNAEPDAEDMDNLAGAPQQPELYEDILMDQLYEVNNVSNNQSAFLSRLDLKDDYVEQPHGNPTEKVESKETEQNENTNSE